MADTDWDDYAASYDRMAELNPAYQALLGDFLSFVRSEGLADGKRDVLDVGSGTANFSVAMAKANPEARLTLVEPSAEMQRRALAKLEGHASVAAETGTLEEATLSTSGYDLILSTHALYTTPDPAAHLRHLRSCCRVNGWLYVVDLGRVMNILDWRLYLTPRIVAAVGFFEAIRLLRFGENLARHNRAIREQQLNGTYWVHTAEEMTFMLQETGWQVMRQWTTYRGYSDAAVCRPA
ncbi:MAG: methyltransferase domain-containing protein [Pseudomonadota bacterium]